MDSEQQITALLNGLRTGDHAARSQVLELLYPELRKIAAQHMRRERREHTLQTTALVNEAYLRLAGKQDQHWENRIHFFALASHVMRQILVDHARQHRSVKRGGAAIRVDLELGLLSDAESADAILEIDRALEQLSSWDARQADIVVMRFFGGLTEEEIATVLSISSRTVKRDWKMARAWLQGVLKDSAGNRDSSHDA